MNKVSAFLKKKVGPLPAGAWLGIVVVAAIAYRLFFSKQANAASADATPTDATGVAGTPDMTGYGSVGGGGDTSTGSTLDTGALLGDFSDALNRGNPDVSALAGIVGELGIGGLQIGDNAVSSLGNVAEVQAGSLGDIGTTLSDALASENSSLVSAVVKHNATVVVNSPSPTRYYTYKKDVPLTGGATLGFTPGRGYYAKPASGQQVATTTTKAQPVSTGTGATSTAKKPPSPAMTDTGKKPVGPPQKVAPAPAPKYFTYQKDVKLGPGQTLHFTKGKGYYAA